MLGHGWEAGEMRLKDMKVGLRYVVTKGGTVLNEGDHVWVCDDGVLMRTEEENRGWGTLGGSVDRDNWHRLQNTVRIDVEYYEKIKEGMRSRIEEIDVFLKENSG